MFMAKCTTIEHNMIHSTVIVFTHMHTLHSMQKENWQKSEGLLKGMTSFWGIFSMTSFFG